MTDYWTSPTPSSSFRAVRYRWAGGIVVEKRPQAGSQGLTGLYLTSAQHTRCLQGWRQTSDRRCLPELWPVRAVQLRSARSAPQAAPDVLENTEFVGAQLYQARIAGDAKVEQLVCGLLQQVTLRHMHCANTAVLNDLVSSLSTSLQ